MVRARNPRPAEVLTHLEPETGLHLACSVLNGTRRGSKTLAHTFQLSHRSTGRDAAPADRHFEASVTNGVVVRNAAGGVAQMQPPVQVGKQDPSPTVPLSQPAGTSEGSAK